MTFDKREAFSNFNGRRMPFDEFMEALGDLRIAYLWCLPADVGRRELYEMAQSEGWLIEESGFVTVNVEGNK